MSLIEAKVAMAELGHGRRNQRVLTIVASLLQGQTSDTNATPGTGTASPWAHSMAAYRLYNNDEITLPALYAAAAGALQELVPPGDVAYVAHDFSVVDSTTHNDKKDRCRVGNERGMGYDLYGALVLDAAGRPLGPVAVELRGANGCFSSDATELLPYVDHFEQVERGIQAAHRVLPGRRCIHLMDREFDDVGLQRFLDGCHGEYVIRAQHLGRIVDHGGTEKSLQAAAATISLRRGDDVEREKQVFERWVGETTVVFARPSLRGRHRGGKSKQGAAITVRVVVVELRAGGADKATYRGVLLTNIPDDAKSVVEAYLARWRIERFFYLTKIGLRLEQWRQQTIEATARRLAVTMLAAMAIYQLLATKDEPAVREVATLGGWLGRKNDSLGPVVMMRGMLLLVGSLCAIAEHGVDGLVRIARDVGLDFAIPPALRFAART